MTAAGAAGAGAATAATELELRDALLRFEELAVKHCVLLQQYATLEGQLRQADAEVRGRRAADAASQALRKMRA